MPYKDKEDYKKYQKKYHKDWYDMNKENRRKQIKERKFKIYEEVANLKSTNKCKICKESNPVALDFHHLSNKKFGISAGISSGYNLKKIVDEISKCIVLCANCHRKEHHDKKENKNINNREKINNFKSINKCKICKESNPVALDFHHLSDKKFEISKVSSSRCSLKHIMNEISKCILLCANCHRKEHYREKSESSHS